jgi:hypothetical protein
MRRMTREILSTTRPTEVRLAGFLCLATGAMLAGIGATREWAAVGFPDDLEHAADVPWQGTDVWEGRAVLLAAGVALVALLAMRLSQSGRTRRSLALVVVLLGAACVVLPLLDAARAEDRFGGAAGVDRMAEVLAAELELPEDVVREQLSEQFERALRVDVGPGVWPAAAGGLLLVTGGLLSLAWVRGREASESTEGALVEGSS